MNISKRFLWIGLAAVMMLSAGAAFAQEDATRSNPGLPGSPPPGWEAGAPPEVDPASLPPRPPWQGYTYSATLTCSTATRLAGESQGEVAQSYSSLREAIGSSNVLAVIPGGAVFDIISGPVCSGGYHWYQVSYHGIVGWVTEGYANDYWLEPVALG